MQLVVGSDWQASQVQYQFDKRTSSITPLEIPSRTGITSVLVNDLQIEIDEDGRALYFWGLFLPLSKCVASTIQFSTIKRKSIFFVDDSSWLPGISKRINSARWCCYIDRSCSMLGVVEQSLFEDSEIFEFNNNSFIGIKNGGLASIWLQVTNL